jgi:protein SCO1/2
MRVPAILSLLLAACGAPESGSAPDRAAEPAVLLDGESLFQLEMTLEDQAGRPFELAQLRGHPVLVAFFYSRCDTMCPRILSDLRRTEAGLTPEARQALRVVLVSFDGERDTVARLGTVAAERSIELDRWTLVRGEDAEVRTLAATLGMTYRRTDDGEYAHAALTTLLDGEGRVVRTVEGTGADEAPMRAAIERLVAGASPPG